MNGVKRPNPRWGGSVRWMLVSPEPPLRRPHPNRGDEMVVEGKQALACFAGELEAPPALFIICEVADPGIRDPHHG